MRTILLLLIPLLALTGCSPEKPAFHSRFLAFGTLMDVTLVGTSQQQAEQAADTLEAEFLEMHKAWHAWQEGPLQQVNRRLESGELFTPPASILTLIRLGRELSINSGGLFNPAIGKLIDSWGFHRDDPQGGSPPPEPTIARLLEQNPRMEDIEIIGSDIRSRNPAVKLDLGAFAKGYAIDLAIERLRALGVENAIVNAGGDLRAIGSRDGIPWIIAIRHPSGEGVIGSIEISGDESVFTSGDYERNFVWKGVRYHHIIDPRTGYPARGTSSVTVIHNDATAADAAATALFVAGPQHWHQVASAMGVGYVLLIGEDGKLYMNPAMQARLRLLEPTDDIRLSPPLRRAEPVGSSGG